ncbi:MAG: hypothetical protein RLY89_2209 [Bacteroidota bacterium]
MTPRKKWTISFAHAFLLMAFSTLWLNSSFTYGDEKLLVQWSSIFKRVVLKMDEEPPKKDYLFINLAYDKALIPREEGTGKDIITDRQLLADFFQVLKKHQDSIKYTVCDVLLKGSSDADSALQESVKGLHRIVFPAQLSDSGKAESLAIQVPSAIADYEMVNGGFLKFKLFQNKTVPTLPVYMYQQISGKELKQKFGWYFQGSRPVMNSLIIDYQIRTHELMDEGEYPVINLSELMLLPEEVIANDFLKHRFIIMGDFNNDTHETIYGSTPGTLILLNVYLSLMDGQHLISLWWWIFLLVGFTFFSRRMLFPEPDPITHQYANLWIPLLRSATFLSILSIISYLLFKQHIQVLVLTLYVNTLRFIIQLRKSDWHFSQLKTWFLEIRETYFNFN